MSEEITHNGSGPEISPVWDTVSIEPQLSTAQELDEDAELDIAEGEEIDVADEEAEKLFEDFMGKEVAASKTIEEIDDTEKKEESAKIDKIIEREEMRELSAQRIEEMLKAGSKKSHFGFEDDYKDEVEQKRSAYDTEPAYSTGSEDKYYSSSSPSYTRVSSPAKSSNIFSKIADAEEKYRAKSDREYYGSDDVEEVVIEQYKINAAERRYRQRERNYAYAIFDSVQPESESRHKDVDDEIFDIYDLQLAAKAKREAIESDQWPSYSPKSLWVKIKLGFYKIAMSLFHFLSQAAYTQRTDIPRPRVQEAPSSIKTGQATQQSQWGFNRKAATS